MTCWPWRVSAVHWNGLTLRNAAVALLPSLLDIFRLKPLLLQIWRTRYIPTHLDAFIKLTVLFATFLVSRVQGTEALLDLFKVGRVREPCLNFGGG